MKVTIIDIGSPASLEPLTCKRKMHEIPVAGLTLEERLHWMFQAEGGKAEHSLEIRPDFWPSENIISALIESTENLLIRRADGIEAAKLTVEPDAKYQEITCDADSIIIRYPWDVLAVNERIVESIEEDRLNGAVRERVSIDGKLVIGAGSVLLPGVFIEGKVIIGEKCKIGPNCYIRGNTSIGDNCHIGQAVEIKNSLIMNNVSAGHLSYIGDSIICPHVNLGAGSISANFRHDGRNHCSTVDNELVDTGRRKFGVILGDNVHTGIHTSFYPGRKMWPDTATLPGETVSRDKH